MILIHWIFIFLFFFTTNRVQSCRLKIMQLVRKQVKKYTRIKKILLVFGRHKFSRNDHVYICNSFSLPHFFTVTGVGERTRWCAGDIGRSLPHSVPIDTTKPWARSRSVPPSLLAVLLNIGHKMTRELPSPLTSLSPSSSPVVTHSVQFRNSGDYILPICRLIFCLLFY